MLSSLDANTASELVRLSIVFAILTLNSYTDLKYRTVWGKDRHYFALGCLGVGIFVLGAINGAEIDAQQGNNINSLQYTQELFSMFLAITFAFIMFRFKGLYTGDLILVLLISIFLPTVFGIKYFALYVMFFMTFLLAVFIISYNVLFNVLWKVRPPHIVGNIPVLQEPLPASSLSWFGRIKQYIVRKSIFFTTHRKRSWERYVAFIDDGTFEEIKQSPLFRSIKTNQRVFWPKNKSRTGELVMVASPVMPFILLAVITALVVRLTIFPW